MNPFRKVSTTWALALFCVFLSGKLFAAQARVRFTVSGYDSGSPDESISGSIDIDLDENSHLVTASMAVNLTINVHEFHPCELGFSEYGSFDIVGVHGEGLGSSTGIAHGAPFDFWILWHKGTDLTREYFYMGVVADVHGTKHFDSFSIDPRRSFCQRIVFLINQSEQCNSSLLNSVDLKGRTKE